MRFGRCCIAKFGLQLVRRTLIFWELPVAPDAVGGDALLGRFLPRLGPLTCVSGSFFMFFRRLAQGGSQGCQSVKSRNSVGLPHTASNPALLQRNMTWGHASLQVRRSVETADHCGCGVFHAGLGIAVDASVEHNGPRGCSNWLWPCIGPSAASPASVARWAQEMRFLLANALPRWKRGQIVPQVPNGPRRWE